MAGEWGKPVNIEEAMARMTSMESYHCSPFLNPSGLKKKAGELLDRLQNLTDTWYQKL